MKKFLLLLTLVGGSLTMSAQGLDFGIKAGANFANFNGDVDSSGITSFHAGGVLELSLVPMFSV